MGFQKSQPAGAATLVPPSASTLYTVFQINTRSDGEGRPAPAVKKTRRGPPGYRTCPPVYAQCCARIRFDWLVSIRDFAFFYRVFYLLYRNSKWADGAAPRSHYEKA